MAKFDEIQILVGMREGVKNAVFACDVITRCGSEVEVYCFGADDLSAGDLVVQVFGFLGVENPEDAGRLDMQRLDVPESVDEAGFHATVRRAFEAHGRNFVPKLRRIKGGDG